ncbi:hypothetical protein FJZ27_04640 [Candidatus Peribacteria bacterium]|nr:hypothetical protein [Candidatus Peribacteria bacterium]
MARDTIPLLPILKHRRFLIGYGACLLPCIMMIGANVLYLRHSEEYMPIPDLVALQRAGSGVCIYGTAIHQNDLAYKLEGHRQAKPFIAAIGSSRVMQMRERYFAKPFYNLGGAVRSVDHGWHVARALLAEDAPDVLLIGIDLWWFNDAVRPPTRTASLPDQASIKMNIRSWTLPTLWLLQGKLQPLEYVRTAMHAPLPSALCALGVQGQHSRTGFGPDGSHYYTSIITGKDAPTSTVTLIRKRIATGSERFQYRDHIHPVHWTQFLEMLEMLKKAGVRVILFLPPMHPKIVEDLEKYAAHYGYIAELRGHLQTLGIPFFDFHDPTSIGSSACEFIDAYHGGDVTSARMLQYIYEQSGDPVVRSAIAMDIVKTTIAENAGLAMAKDPRVTTSPEVDFLGMGCRKW